MSERRTAPLESFVGRKLDADQALRSTVAAVAAEPGVCWAGIALVKDGELELVASAGIPDEERRIGAPIVVRDAVVGELSADGDVDATLLERVATLIGAYVLTAPQLP